MMDAASNAAARIATLSPAAFTAVVGQPLAVQIATDPFVGQVLAGAVLVAVHERPRAAMPGSLRMPFILLFKVADPGAFVAGDCNISVPDQGWLGPVYCERTLPPASDPSGAYFAIGFA
jgi:hypothetical protein